jgi:LPS-assembly lipoprotein
MSWPSPSAPWPAALRRGVWLLLALSLCGCGFRPLYAPRAPQDWDPDLAAIAVNPMPNRPGQILELALREDLNPGGASVAPRWHLATTLTVARTDLGIQRNATATSSEITVTASYTVTDTKTGAAVYSSSSRAVGDFNQLNDAYATQVGADDAQDRALHELADEMAVRMALFVRQQRTKPASP